MSFLAGCDDPWMPSTDTSMQHHDLDLVDGFGQEGDQAHPMSMLTQGGSPKPMHTPLFMAAQLPTIVKFEAYQALRAPSTTRAYFGLDHTSGQCKTGGSVATRDEDPGYAAADLSGHVPDHVAVIRCLLQHKDLIDRNDMIYLT